jgi:SAM-dependent methyltransferase
MRHLTTCLACGSGNHAVVLEATYDGGVEEAHRFFLSHRERAVHGQVLGCRECGFQFTSPQFEPAEYDRIYGSIPPPPAGAPPSADEQRFVRLARIVRERQAPARFLDFGCGGGRFLDQLPDYRGVGFEVRTGQPLRWDGRICHGELAEARRTLPAFADGSFDFAVAWDVLEHLPDIEGDIRAMHDLIRPGGLFFVTVPDVSSPAARVLGRRWGCYLLEHLWYFSPTTLGMFMERMGFRRRHDARIGYPASLGALFDRIDQTFGTKLKPPAALGRAVLPLPIGLLFGVYERV